MQAERYRSGFSPGLSSKWFLLLNSRTSERRLFEPRHMGAGKDSGQPARGKRVRWVLSGRPNRRPQMYLLSLGQ